MEKTRLEAFSDGVFAIAITLLALDLRIPAGHGNLWHQLLDAWPHYFAYLVSFAVIGIMWVNHHALCRYVAVVDRPMLFLNLLLLAVVAAIPFPTALLAEHVAAGGSDAHAAAFVYAVTMLLAALAFNALWRWIVHDARLLHERIQPEQARSANRRFGVGIFVYGASIALAFVNALAMLAVHAGIALYYVFDQLGGVEAGQPHE